MLVEFNCPYLFLLLMVSFFYYTFFFLGKILNNILFNEEKKDFLFQREGLPICGEVSNHHLAWVSTHMI